MRKVIFLVLLAFILGCQSTSRVDPYVSMMDNYVSELENWDYGSGEKPVAPKEPTFLSTKPSPWLGVSFGHPAGYGGRGWVWRNSTLRSESGAIIARREEINEQRRTAYDTALSKYQAVTARIDGEKSGEPEAQK